MKSIPELLNLTNKVALVTGGARGIGYGISYRLAEAGAKVIIADMDENNAQSSADKLTGMGWLAEAHKVDVTSEADVRQMTNDCHEKFGSIDILVNNAGIYPSAPLEQMTEEQFEKIIHVNLRSVFFTTKYVSDVMKQHGGGKIINISSIDSMHPSAVGLSIYDASKHGVWGFTKSSALELAEHKIWVNSIAPGGIDTPGTAAIRQTFAADLIESQTKAYLAKIPMHRTGEPDDIGMVALFLASGLSSYMTGEQVIVDGGVLLT